MYILRITTKPISPKFPLFYVPAQEKIYSTSVSENQRNTKTTLKTPKYPLYTSVKKLGLMH